MYFPYIDKVQCCAMVVAWAWWFMDDKEGFILLTSTGLEQINLICITITLLVHLHHLHSHRINDLIICAPDLSSLSLLCPIKVLCPNIIQSIDPRHNEDGDMLVPSSLNFEVWDKTPAPLPVIQLLLLVPLLPHLVESDQNVEQRDQESRLSEDLILYYNVNE